MRKKLRAITAILLAVLLLTTALPFSVLAATETADSVGASSGTTGDCTWILNDDGTLTISGNGSIENHIYSDSNPWGNNITSVCIKNGVTNIGNYAFVGCASLTSVTIPDSVTSIGEGAFVNCTSLTSVTIPDSVTSIGKYAFYDTGLTNITIPDSVTSIGNYAFYDTAWYNAKPDGLVYAGKVAYKYKGTMPSGTSVVLKSGTKSIGDSAFYDCTGLTSVTIPNSVTSIGEGAFDYCSGLNEVHITNLVAWCSIDFYDDDANPLTYANNLFLDNELVTNLIIPNSVTSIGDWAFCNCTGLTSVTIPDSVISVGENAFDYCSGLNDVYITDLAAWSSINFHNGTSNPLSYANNLYLHNELVTNVTIPDSMTSIGNYAFTCYSGLTSVTIPNSVTSIGEGAFSHCIGLTSVIIPNSVTSIGNLAFYGCTGLTSVTIPDSVTSIGDRAFYGCTGLTSVTIPDSVTSIGYGAFRGCTGLTRVTIPDNVTSIGSDAFYECTSLTSVTIGNGVTSIGDYAFRGCTGLISVTIGNNVTSIGDSAFFDCTSLTRVTIPDSVTSIDSWAFGRCTGLTSVTIGNGVTSIGDRAFSDCTGLISINIPDSVTSIGRIAFSGCKSLTRVTIPDSVTSIGGDAFYECTGLTSVTIGNGVTRIGDYAFKGCTDLTHITIGNGVTSIGTYAFKDCTGLTSVNISDMAAWCNISFSDGYSNPLAYANNLYFNNKLVTNLIIPDSVTSISNNAFSGCTGLTSVTIPDSVTSIGKFAFCNCTGLTGIMIPDSVTSIGYCAFKGCTSLTSVIIPDSVTSFGNCAFEGCIGLTSITIGKGVTNIGNYAFSGCTSLTSVTIPDSMTSIDNSAFYGCYNLTNVSIPDSITTINRYAFQNCQQLSDVYFGGNESQWSRIEIGYGNDYLTSATIHFKSFTRTLTPVITNFSSSSQTSSQTSTISIKTANNSTVNIELEKDLSFTVPSNVPLIGGGNMKLDLSFVPVTAAITDNSIRIGIGYNRDLTKDTDEQTWCNWKNYVKGYKDAVSKGKGLFDDVMSKKKGIASAGMGTDLDFEFYGYFEGTIQNGQIVGSGNAKIKLEGALKNEWQTAIGFVPIVIKLKGKVGLENTASLSLNFSTKELSFKNQLDITLPQITASAGVGIAHIADLSVYGEAKNVFSIYSKPKKVTGTLFGELGVSAKAFLWSAKLPLVSIGNGSGWTYYDSSKKFSSSSVGAFDYDDLNFTINRSYLKNQSEWQSGKSKASDSVGASGYDTFTYNVLQTSIYDGAAPKLIKTDDDMILVWTGDDKTRSDGNQTVVYYSVFDNDTSTWSAPIAVEDNGTADFTPDIATDGENTYLTWADAKTVFDSNVEMSEAAAACEIKLAKFNSSTKQFEDVTLLTNNNTLDISPNVAVTNGSVAVVWKNNSANAFLENTGTETIYKATKTTNGFTTTAVYSSQNKIYELITDGENTVLSVDGDGNLADATDSEIFVINSQNLSTKLTDNSSIESNLSFSRINGENVLTYLCDGTLYGSTNLTTSTSLSDVDTMIFGQYQFVGDRLFSVENIEGSAEIFSYSTNEEGLWSDPVQVSFTEKYIRNPSFVDNDGEIDCVFLNTSAIISEDDVIETTDLCTSVIPDFHSIEIEDISYNSEDVIPGEDLPITIALHNNGTVDESMVTVNVFDENGNTVVTDNISKEIKSGQCAKIETEVSLDSSLNSKTTYTVTVNGTNCNVSDELSIGYTQLMLSTKTGIQDDTLGLLLNVSNDSAIATNARLVVKASEDAEEVLDTFWLGELSANTALSYYLNNEKICAYKAQTDNLYLELVSEKDEISLADNTAIVRISSFSPYKLGDTNLDSKTDIRDVTAIQRHLADLEPFTEEQLAVADTNGDGEINIADATHLQMYLAEYDVKLG